MQKLQKVFSARRGEKGFTLVEILIVIAILGILAAVIVPNLSRFLGTGTLESANTEARSVKAAALAYYTNSGTFPDTSDDLSGYYDGALKGYYDFSSSGLITSAEASGWGESISWDLSGQVWVNTPPPTT